MLPVGAAAPASASGDASSSASGAVPSSGQTAAQSAASAGSQAGGNPAGNRNFDPHSDQHGPLPGGWERRMDHLGRQYYVDQYVPILTSAYRPSATQEWVRWLITIRVTLATQQLADNDLDPTNDGKHRRWFRRRSFGR